MASSCITSKQRAAKEVETLMESIFENTPWWSNDVLQPYIDNLTVKVQERKDALQTQREATVQRDEKKAECLETEAAAERVLADLREKREVVQSERQQLANITWQLEEVKQKLEEVNGERHKLEERNNTEEEMEKTAQHKYIAQLYSKITEMRLDNTAPEGSIRAFMFGPEEVRHFVVEREQETLEHATTRLWDLLQEMENQKAPIQINNAVESPCHGDTKT